MKCSNGGCKSLQRWLANGRTAKMEDMLIAEWAGQVCSPLRKELVQEDLVNLTDVRCIDSFGEQLSEWLRNSRVDICRLSEIESAETKKASRSNLLLRCGAGEFCFAELCASAPAAPRLHPFLQCVPMPPSKRR